MTSTRKIGHGFVLGKFMPLHEGHLHLLYFAQMSSHALTIMVCTTERDPIPGEIRYGWVKAMFPTANVVHHYAAIPQEPDDSPDFWPIWMKSIARHCPGEHFDAVFGSEDYGWQLADRLGCEYIPVNRIRDRVPTSGTAVRADPMGNWQFLPPIVRPYFAKRVAVIGPMSTGKSTLVTSLAKHFETVYADEYARGYFDDLIRTGKRADGEVLESDFPAIARGQMVLEESMAFRTNRLLICDTDILTTYCYAKWLFNGCDRWIEHEALTKGYDCTFLLKPNEDDFVQDGQRVMVGHHRRLGFFEELMRTLDRTKRPFVVLDGKMETRFDRAVSIVAPSSVVTKMPKAERASSG